MNVLRFALAAALAAAPLAAAQSTPSASSAPTIPVAKSNVVTMAGYTFTAAGGWVMLKNTYTGDPALAGVALAWPMTGGKLNPGFYVLVSDLKDVKPADRTLGMARDVRAEELPTTIKDFKWLGEKTVKVGGKLGVLWTYSGKEQNASVRWTQLMMLKGDKLYTVTLNVPDGTPAAIAQSGRAMLDSFRLR